LLIQVLQGVELVSAEADFNAADANGDGQTDVQDLIRLIQSLIGVNPLN